MRAKSPSVLEETRSYFGLFMMGPAIRNSPRTQRNVSLCLIIKEGGRII